MPLIPLLDCHLIDCSSIMAFSGADFANPNKFISYRSEIWNFIEKQISLDRLKTVRQVWGELQYNDPDSTNRLQRYHSQMILPSENDTELRIINILSKYPKLVDKNQHYTREPADPFLIAYAQRLGIGIICDEKPLRERKGARKNKRIMIPDVCEAEKNIECINIETYLKNEAVIPANYDPNE